MFSLNVSAQVPTDAAIDKRFQTITGSTATASWGISWYGGDLRNYNVRFNYGDGNNFTDTRANYFSRNLSYRYSLGSLSTTTYNQTLIVNSGGTTATVSSTVRHNKY